MFLFHKGGKIVVTLRGSSDDSQLNLNFRHYLMNFHCRLIFPPSTFFHVEPRTFPRYFEALITSSSTLERGFSCHNFTRALKTWRSLKCFCLPSFLRKTLIKTTFCSIFFKSFCLNLCQETLLNLPHSYASVFPIFTMKAWNDQQSFYPLSVSVTMHVIFPRFFIIKHVTGKRYYMFLPSVIISLATQLLFKKGVTCRLGIVLNYFNGKKFFKNVTWNDLQDSVEVLHNLRSQSIQGALRARWVGRRNWKTRSTDYCSLLLCRCRTIDSYSIIDGKKLVEVVQCLRSCYAHLVSLELIGNKS